MDTAVFEDAAIAAYGTRSQWDAAAAGLVATALQRWHLTAGAAYVGGEAASVLRVTTADGVPAVLKVGFPHVEAVGEALALEAWAGMAPRVLNQDAWTWSLLLERVDPGNALQGHEASVEHGIGIASELLCRIAARDVPAGIPRLADIVGAYRRDAEARLPHDRDALAAFGASELMQHALERIDELLASPGLDAFLHGDYNPGNVLQRGENEWVVIDPKPMVGELEFDLAPLAEQLGSPLGRTNPATALRTQLAIAVDATGTDLARATQWAFVRSALNISWALQDGDRAAAAAAVRATAAWRANAP